MAKDKPFNPKDIDVEDDLPDKTLTPDQEKQVDDFIEEMQKTQPVKRPAS